ncbi:hypothetical protein EII42_12175 [Tessaracoccus sp. OH4464_COT-324]|nr:hypothetical protein EII42_12175 [Tessaracoccus sp. OH4464_COT-324]
MRTLELPDMFNRYLRQLEGVHYVGRFTCGKSDLSKDTECFAYAEDTVIALRPTVGRFTEQEMVDALDELVDHLLATR